MSSSINFTLKIAFFLGLLISCWYGFYLAKEVNVCIEDPYGSHSIVKMPRREALQLECFFREILIPDSLAYTLVGVKPLSFTHYITPGSSWTSFSPANLKVFLGWKVWKKYQCHFQTNRMILWEEKSPWVEKVNFLMLADIDQCYQSIEQNADDFQSILGAQSKDLFTDVDQVSLLTTKLQKHDALIGILLGFGKKNSWLYFQNTRNSKVFTKLPLVWDSMTEKESSNYVWKRFTLQTLNMSDLKLPAFVGDPDSEESKQLKQRYLNAREKIENYYKAKDFLSATLSLYKYGSCLLDRMNL